MRTAVSRFGCGCTSLIFVARRAYHGPDPVIKRCLYGYINRSTTITFIVRRRLPRFLYTVRQPCGPDAFTLAEKETWKKTKYLKDSRKQQQAILEHVFGRPSRKREKKLHSMVQQQVRVSRYLIRTTSRTPSTNTHEQTGRGAYCKKLRRKETDALLTWLFGLGATCDVSAPAQRKNCLYSSISSRWDHEKTNVVLRRPEIY